MGGQESAPFHGDADLIDAIRLFGRGEFERAHELFLKDESSPSVSRLFLGRMYFDGNGFPRDPNKAIEYLLESGSPSALELVAQIYDNGDPDGVEKDRDRAIELYKRSDTPVSHFRLGRLFLDEDPPTSLKHFQISADRNFVPGMEIVGLAYRDGAMGCSQDGLQSEKYLLQAFEASQGDGRLAYHLGVLYNFVPPVVNVVKAKSYYRISGSPRALFSLGRMFYHDKCKPNEADFGFIRPIPTTTTTTADRLDEENEDEGEEEEEEEDQLQLQLQLHEPEESESEPQPQPQTEIPHMSQMLCALLYMQRAISMMADPPAQMIELVAWLLNPMNAKTRDVEDIPRGRVVLERMMSYYTAAAEKGSKFALNHLACAHESGVVGEVNGKLAVHYHEKAAELGCVDSFLHLGTMYSQGEIVERDDTLAERWFREVEKRASVHDWMKMAHDFEFADDDLPMDRKRAARYYRKAVEVVKTKDLRFVRQNPTEALVEFHKRTLHRNMHRASRLGIFTDIEIIADEDRPRTRTRTRIPRQSESLVNLGQCRGTKRKRESSDSEEEPEERTPKRRKVMRLDFFAHD